MQITAMQSKAYTQMSIYIYIHTHIHTHIDISMYMYIYLFIFFIYIYLYIYMQDPRVPRAVLERAQGGANDQEEGQDGQGQAAQVGGGHYRDGRA